MLNSSIDIHYFGLRIQLIAIKMLNPQQEISFESKNVIEETPII